MSTSPGLPTPSPPPRERTSRGALLAIALLVALVLVLVGLSLRRPELPEYAPTAIGGPTPEGPGPHLLTVDASDPERWRHVDLARGSVVDDTASAWDLAFRRFEVRVNGGPGAAGQGGVLDLGPVAMDSLTTVPEDGYRGMEVRGRDTALAVVGKWYAYSYTTHVLRPLDRTFAIRTASGRHAVLRFMGYYCPGAQPGCVTVRYRFVD